MKKLFILIPIFFFTFSILGQGTKTINFRSQNAPMMHFGLVKDNFNVNFELMYALLQNLNIGLVGFKYQAKSDDDYNHQIQSLNMGIRADFVFAKNGFSDGFYVSDAILLGQYETTGIESHLEGCENSFKEKGNNLVATIGIGYQWYWASGLNLNMGVGYVESKALSANIKHTNSCQSVTNLTPKGDNHKNVLYDLGFGFAI